ncbi:Uu.00g042880.m01.CDS01 [Anthostomella pinea]|uniref:Uu.00g042880.m01.CDS01 n=1 Tax=Anthostomella pinea TaxID=933095 RepID=A0AAI8YE54_9PEZI|nr:Uu.00g042880.m01.CDS01 [Anthostomella pinea]
MTFDEEKQAHSSSVSPADASPNGSVAEHNAAALKYDNKFLRRLRNFEDSLDKKIGVESQAIVRVTPEEKRPVKWHEEANMALLWASGVMQLSCFATGFLGPEFGLDLGSSIAITIFGTLLGAAVSGFCATMGPATGLRQVSISRYSFGWYPAKIVAALNVISQIGWSSVGCITGGQALSAVSDGRVSLVLGIVIIAVGALVFIFFGLRAILALNKYAWFIFLVLFLVMYGEAAPHAVSAAPVSEDTGEPLSGAGLSAQALSLLAIVYGSSASWSSIASDYYAHYPVNTSKVKVFSLTTLGITVPTCIGMVLGCCVGSAFATMPDWADTYDNDGIGFLVQTIIYPIGFAKFLLVIFVLAGISMNCINMYSAALSVQQFARPVSLIPRFIWTVVIFGVVIAIALAGRDHLLAVLQNLLALLGYWNTSFFVILFTEHIVFRKRNIANYDLEGWNDPSRLPIGIAAGTAFIVGVVGWILGMVTTWYIGVAAAAIGGGGDIGNQLTLMITLVIFLPLRYWERKKFGR